MKCDRTHRQESKAPREAHDPSGAGSRSRPPPVKPAIAMAAVALMSLAACTTTRRVREMEANRDRPVAHLTEVAIRNHEELFPGHASRLKETDPELIEVFDNFAFDEVLGQGDLDVKTRVMVILASTLGSQALGEYKVMLGAALDVGVTPVEAKEILYQAVPYVGIAKVLDFIHATNEVLQARGVPLPLPPQATTDRHTRRERGLEVQRRVLGERIDQMYAESPMSRPYVICHMVPSVDGRIVTDGWPLTPGLVTEYERTAATFGADGWIIGRISMEPYSGRARLPTGARGKPVSRTDFVARPDAPSYAIAIDPHGKLRWASGAIDDDHVVTVLTERVPGRYLRFLRAQGVSYLFGGRTRIDLPTVLRKLRARFRIRRLLLEGGGKINGSFLAAGVIDELSLLVAPVADGGVGTPSLFDAREGPGPARRLKLLSVERRRGDLLWVRYRVQDSSAAARRGTRRVFDDRKV